MAVYAVSRTFRQMSRRFRRAGTATSQEVSTARPKLIKLVRTPCCELLDFSPSPARPCLTPAPSTPTPASPVRSQREPSGLLQAPRKGRLHPTVLHSQVEYRRRPSPKGGPDVTRTKDSSTKGAPIWTGLRSCLKAEDRRDKPARRGLKVCLLRELLG